MAIRTTPYLPTASYPERCRVEVWDNDHYKGYWRSVGIFDNAAIANKIIAKLRPYHPTTHNGE